MVRWFSALGALAFGLLLACRETARDQALSGGDAPDGGPPTESDATVADVHPGVRHLAVRPRISLGAPSPAFAGEVLGIAAVSHHVERYPADVVVAIERGSEFELVELGSGTSPVLTGSVAGFHAAWLAPVASMGTAVTLKLAHVSTGGSVESVIDVATLEQERLGCGVAAGEGAVAVVCSAGAAICSGAACNPVTLPACVPAGRPAVLRDGPGFAVGRQCEESPSSHSLRYAQLSAAGGWVGPERIIATHSVAGGLHRLPISTPALTHRSGQLLLVGIGSLFPIDSEGNALGPAVAFDRARPYTLHGIDYHAAVSGERTVVIDVGCDGGLEFQSGDGMLSLFGADLSALASIPIIENRCAALGLASSAGGRAVLVRPSPASLLVEDVDLANALRSEPRPVASPVAEPELRGVACAGAECTLALFEPGLDPPEPLFPERTVRLVLGSDQSRTRPLGTRCSSRSCRAFFPAGGDTVIFDPPNLIWQNSAGDELWSRPTPPADHTLEVGASDAPWVGGTDLQSAWHWRLTPAGPEERQLQGPAVAEALRNGSPVFCDDGMYVLSFTSEHTEIYPLVEGGLGQKRGTVTSGNRVLCAAGQFVVFSQAPNPPDIGRLLPDGTVTSVNLGAPIVYFTVAGRSLVLLLRGDDDGQEPWAASLRPVLVELTPDGGLRRRALVLPEPGWFGFLSNLGYFDAGVQITTDYDHLVWKSESALMLSSWPRE